MALLATATRTGRFTYPQDGRSEPAVADLAANDLCLAMESSLKDHMGDTPRPDVEKDPRQLLAAHQAPKARRPRRAGELGSKERNLSKFVGHVYKDPLQPSVRQTPPSIVRL